MDYSAQTKYEVEDDMDVDFFAALKGMQQQSSHALNAQSHDNSCLITDDPLNAFHVTLICGHKFNYDSLYQEVLRQKGRLGIHNYHEKIGVHQIKCPYCRTLTNQLLPYIGPHPTLKRLNGVNAPASMCMPGIECSYNDSCSANAFYEHDSKSYCLRHHNSVLKAASKHDTNSAKVKLTQAHVHAQCCAEIQTGKNRGQKCRFNAHSDSIPPLCNKHSKCNVVIYK